jgi:methionine sulfoxide reductase heme-binding subunit
MALTRRGYLLAAGIVLLYIIITLLAFFTRFTPGNPLGLIIRLSGLYGYIALSIAAIMTPFLREIYQNFGKPFLRVHHLFAVIGVALITLHPLVLLARTLSLGIFVPDLGSWEGFLRTAGRPALYLIYIAAIAALARANIQKYWRPVHALVLVALLFGLAHAILIGTDFASPAILVIYVLLFVGAVGAYTLKVWRRRLAGQERAKKRATKPKA